MWDSMCLSIRTELYSDIGTEEIFLNNVSNSSNIHAIVIYNTLQNHSSIYHDYLLLSPLSYFSLAAPLSIFLEHLNIVQLLSIASVG